MLHVICRLWLPTSDQPVDVTDVMEHIRELARAYDVQAVSYDPRFFDVPAKMLLDEGLPLVEIPQSVERMTPACGSLLEIIKSGKLRHDGDEGLASHILNAVPRFNERGFTLQKSKSRGRIDATIALALAIDRALHTEPEQEPMLAWR
jgi:phage terminase large subunit-like protein